MKKSLRDLGEPGARRPDVDYYDDPRPERQRIDRSGNKNSESEQEVRELIEGFLRQAMKEAGDLSLDERLEIANRLSLEARDQHPGVQKYRDAEYYLMALSAGAKRDALYSVALGGIPLYDAVKSVAINLKEWGLPQLEQLMRSGDGPLTKPGMGAEWARRGLRDGWQLPGDIQIRVPRDRDMKRHDTLDAPDMQKQLPIPKG